MKNTKTKVATKQKTKALNKALVIKSLPIQKPPYNCPSDGKCIYPNCGCEWFL
jgi:hypothetical protein